MNYQELINSGIKNLRRQNGLTQEEFAEKIGVSIQGLSNIERNRYQPTAETVDKICKVFKITPAELLTKPDGEKDEIVNEIKLLLAQCSKRKLKKIYEILRIIIKL